MNSDPKRHFCNDATACSMYILAHCLNLQSSASLPKFESQKAVFFFLCLIKTLKSSCIFSWVFAVQKPVEQHCSSSCTKAKCVVDAYRD